MRRSLRSLCLALRRTGTPNHCLAVLLVVMTLSSASGEPAGQSHWLDVESRIQYGYFTEDPRALRNLLEPLAAGDSHDVLKSYYAGLLAYRLMLLADAQADKSTAGQKPAKPSRESAQGNDDARQLPALCVSSLDRALQARSDFADALALQAVCLRRLTELPGWHTPFAGSKSSAQLTKALRLAPKNPRVLLLDAIDDFEHQTAHVGEPHACEKFKHTAALFDAERADLDQVPGWGAAEAYMWLGRCYLGIGDVLPARDALERALLVAPEFAVARRLLSSITSG